MKVGGRIAISILKLPSPAPSHNKTLVFTDNHNHEPPNSMVLKILPASRQEWPEGRGIVSLTPPQSEDGGRVVGRQCIVSDFGSEILEQSPTVIDGIGQSTKKKEKKTNSMVLKKVAEPTPTPPPPSPGDPGAARSRPSIG